MKNVQFLILVSFTSRGAEIEIIEFFNFADKPSAPRGPLDVRDVMEDSCTISWRAADSDGGEPITHYIVEQKDVSSREWQIVEQTTELSMVIGKLQAKHSYHFRVKAVNKIGQSQPLETKSSTLAKNPYGRLCL